MLDLTNAQWVDYPGNPILEPPRPEWMIADPAVLTPEQTPDGLWHLMANSVGFINHYRSPDGLTWEKVNGRLFQGIRPFLYWENGTYYLLYERFLRPWRSGIALRTSHDLERWSEPVMLLIGRGGSDGWLLRYAGNPCIVKQEDRYLLYFSHNWVFLRDCLYFEPRCISRAIATAIHGPYRRDPAFLLDRDPASQYFNRGAGSVKLISDQASGWWCFHNGIYNDAGRRSRSAIHLFHTDDGLTFKSVRQNPIIAPETGWKQAFVYACIPVIWHDHVRLYYNARDGWFKGSERIGLATASIER